MWAPLVHRSSAVALCLKQHGLRDYCGTTTDTWPRQAHDREPMHFPCTSRALPAAIHVRKQVDCCGCDLSSAWPCIYHASSYHCMWYNMWAPKAPFGEVDQHSPLWR
jgi:hypothetical protein